MYYQQAIHKYYLSHKNNKGDNPKVIKNRNNCSVSKLGSVRQNISRYVTLDMREGPVLFSVVVL